MTFEEKIRQEAIEYIEMTKQIDKLNLIFEETAKDFENLNLNKSNLAKKLLECVGNNVPERFIIIESKLVKIHYKDGISIKPIIS